MLHHRVSLRRIAGNAMRRLVLPLGALVALAAIAATAAVAYRLITGRTRLGKGRPRTVETAVTVESTPVELYRFWRDLSNLPRLTHHLEDVTVLDDRRSRWRARAPGNRTVEWEAEITADTPGESLAWRSVDGDIPNSGELRFLPATGGRGTVVKARLEFEPPGGRVGVALARLFGQEPEQQLKDAMRSFKQLIEAGEISTTDGQPTGRGGGR